MTKKVSFHTFGCRLNQAETASISNSFARRGYAISDRSESSDVAVINTCTVTANGDQDTRKLVNRIARTSPNTKIALIGCQAQLQAEKLAALPNVQWVVGNARKMDLVSIIDEGVHSPDARTIVDPISAKSFTIANDGIDSRHTRANLKIQDGCDFHCFFCVIPYARGRARSREFWDLIREAKNLAAAGHKEIVLTGVNIGTYEHDGKQFLDIVDELEGVNGLARVRISSIEPTTIPDALFARMGRTNLCRFLHVPLQSGSDELLFKMNRRYTVADYREFINEAFKSVPEVCLGTDVIVGYPGETDTHFEETLDLLTELPLNYFHVFSYSEREDAKSKLFDGQVSPVEIKRRSRVLRELSHRKRQRYMERFLGTTVSVLFEQKKTEWTGVTDNFIRVRVKSDSNLKNEVVPVRLEKVDGGEMTGTIA